MKASCLIVSSLSILRVIIVVFGHFSPHKYNKKEPQKLYVNTNCTGGGLIYLITN